MPGEVRLKVAWLPLPCGHERSLPVLAGLIVGLIDIAGLGEVESILEVFLIALASAGVVADFLILPLDASDLVIGGSIGVGVILRGMVRDVVEMRVRSGPEGQLLVVLCVALGVRRVVVPGLLGAHS